MKWITTSSNGGTLNTGETMSVDGYASEDEANSDVNAPSNQGIKVRLTKSLKSTSEF
jgi:hypothetical protein